jgi:hypothetical protein
MRILNLKPNKPAEAPERRTAALTVQLCGDIINDTLLCVRVLNCWIIICHEVALKNIKADQLTKYVVNK